MNISSGKFLILFLTSFSFACDNDNYILPPVITHLKFTTKNVIHEISTTNNQVVLNSTKNGKYFIISYEKKFLLIKIC